MPRYPYRNTLSIDELRRRHQENEQQKAVEARRQQEGTSKPSDGPEPSGS